MIASKKIVTDGYDIVNSASCCEKQHHKGQREDYPSVILVYPGIEGMHESLFLTAIAASSVQLT
jgi:hypothetical protein